MSKIEQAIALLQDDQLVWSDDFEHLRKPLLELLAWLEVIEFDHATPVVHMVEALLGEEPDLVSDDPLENWVFDAARQLGIYQETAGRSESMAAALKKLFFRL